MPLRSHLHCSRELLQRMPTLKLVSIPVLLYTHSLTPNVEENCSIANTLSLSLSSYFGIASVTKKKSFLKLTPGWTRTWRRRQTVRQHHHGLRHSLKNLWPLWKKFPKKYLCWVWLEEPKWWKRVPENFCVEEFERKKVPNIWRTCGLIFWREVENLRMNVGVTGF
jgi:hypothetical protein